LKNNTKSYLESIQNSAKNKPLKGHLKEGIKFKQLKTIEHSDDEKDIKTRTRHHTQPRNYQRHFGLASDYINDTKPLKVDNYSVRF